MGLSHFPHGISSFGVPVMGGAILTTGNIFFVDSGGSLSKDETSHGSKETPFATMDYATGRCTASNGDYVIAMPGHAEVVASAGALTCDVAGVTYLGLGRGTDQPTITATLTTTSDVDIDAANVTFEGFNFVANFADNAIGIDVNATDFTIRNCRFTQAGDDLNCKIWIEDALTTLSNRLTIENCYCIAYDAVNTHFVNFVGTGDGYIIRGNTLIGDWGTMCIGGAGAVTHLVIDNNLISNAASDVDSCINIDSGATGHVSRNLVGSAAAENAYITGAGLVMNQNYGGIVSEDLSGTLEPIET